MTKNHKTVRLRRIFGCNLLFLIFTLPLTAQDLLVTGKVTDGNLPISGANVLIKNTSNGVVTDFDGRYSITAKATDTLQISYLGYTTVTVPIQYRKAIDVVLQEDAMALGEVRINAGYYTITDREKTGSIARITAKDIEMQPVNNPLAAMQGHLSGVNIIQNSGVPGGGFQIEVRGRNFINGVSDPLFIIDGVPFNSQSLGSNNVSGQIFSGNISPLNAINPNDIESIEVLKDADATAIYGSRGANGVVLITTKKGKAGKTHFDAQLSSTLGRVTHFLDLMDTAQFLELRREGVINDGLADALENPAFDSFWPDITLWDNHRYTDWQKELIGGTAYRYNAQLSVSGGSAQTQFLISGAYQKETTVFPGDANYKRSNLHSTISHRSNDDKFRINLSTRYAHENNLMPRTDFTINAYSLAPNAPTLYDEKGNLNWENNTWDNPLASLEEKFSAQINTLMANTMISYSFFDNIEVRANLGFTDYRLDSYRTLPSTARNPRMNLTPQGYSNMSKNQSQKKSWIIEPQLHWNKDWNKIKLDVLLGTTFQQETTQQLVLRGRGFPNNALIQNLAAASLVEALSDSDNNYKYNAIFGRINVKYLDKYILNLTGRKDGSSRFGPDKQFGNFGAVGFAWIFSEESLFSNSSFLNFGKLRGSYGTTGSDNIGDYRFLDTYNITGFDYNGVTILEPTGVFNPLFGWEENKKLEAALELGFFKDLLHIDASWYRNRASNQLIGIPLAATTGFSELTGNFDATVENSGFEIDVQTINLQNKNFKWSTTFNITVPKNKLVKFDGLESSTFADRYIVGRPLSIVNLYHSLGVDAQTGQYQFEDYNGDGTISSSQDRKWVEDLAPKFYGGFGNTFRWGNLVLDIFFQFKKQKAYNSLQFNATPGYSRNASVELLDRWQNPDDIKPFQKASSGLIIGEDRGSLQGRSSAAVSDGSFARLRNISLNYEIPYLENDLKINVYLQGQNLWTLTNYKGPNPEQNSNTRLPQLRQLTLGVQVGF